MVLQQQEDLHCFSTKSFEEPCHCNNSVATFFVVVVCFMAKTRLAKNNEIDNKKIHEEIPGHMHWLDNAQIWNGREIKDMEKKKHYYKKDESKIERK